MLGFTQLLEVLLFYASYSRCLQEALWRGNKLFDLLFVEIILCFNKLINHWLVTITHDLRLKSTTFFFSANSITSAGQGGLTVIASEYMTFPELLMDTSLNCAKDKLSVHAAIKLFNWNRLMRSPELTNPSPRGMTPLKWGFLSKMFVFRTTLKKEKKGKEHRCQNGNDEEAVDLLRNNAPSWTSTEPGSDSLDKVFWESENQELKLEACDDPAITTGMYPSTWPGKWFQTSLVSWSCTITKDK